MSSAERQALLESIAYGADRRVSPSDRLRALQLLEVATRATRELPIDLAAMTDAEIGEVLDGYSSPEIFEAAMNGTGWPVLGGLIRAEIQRQVGLCTQG